MNRELERLRHMEDVIVGLMNKYGQDWRTLAYRNLSDAAVAWVVYEIERVPLIEAAYQEKIRNLEAPGVAPSPEEGP